MPDPSDAYTCLRDFLENRMSMSHVYQPVMLRELLRAGGSATRREIAAAFLCYDESQLQYYEEIVKRYPTAMLRRHGLIEHRRGVYRLASTLSDLRPDERQQLIELCDQRLGRWLEERSDRPWQHRSQNFDPIPGSVRWRVIMRARGRCEGCGVSAADRALHVDHIVPRSQSGSNDEDNLQALCQSCNLEKSDRDVVDFRAAAEALALRQPGCPHCEPDGTKVLAARELAYAVPSGEWPSRYLLVPRRHVHSVLDLMQPELNAFAQLQRDLATLVCGTSGRPDHLETRAFKRNGHCATELTFDPAGLGAESAID